MRHEVAVVSFDHEAVEEMRTKRPDWTYGLLFLFQPQGELSEFDVSFLAVQKRGARAF